MRRAGGEGEGARGEPASKRVEDLPCTKSGGLRANWMLSLGSWGQSTLRSVRTLTYIRSHSHLYPHTYSYTQIHTYISTTYKREMRTLPILASRRRPGASFKLPISLSPRTSVFLSLPSFSLSFAILSSNHPSPSLQ